MNYPSLEQYNYAMQHPKNVLTDPELKKGAIAVNGLGLPRTISGGFALTYTIMTGGTKYAVRCFHKQSNHLEQRYKAISAKLDALHSAYFVKFEFQPQGVSVDGHKFPVVKMAWASGKTLGEFMGASYRNKTHLQELNKSLLSLSAYLEKQRIAHGDIQPGNVMVANEGRTLQLIDYDGMFVEDIKHLGGAELGLRNFQHPGRTAMVWDWQMDRFSFILLNLVARALDIYPDLWNKTQSDEVGFLFRAQDFADPENSDVFRQLLNDPKLKEDVRNFASICMAPYEKIPSPEDFLAKRNIPQVAISISSAGKITRTAYMGAYPVVDASDYNLCLRYVGDRVELIGQITDIKNDGITKFGDPYVFLNFGNWKGKITKIIIWSEALDTFSKVPDESWKGKWISVVGLMEPPDWKYHHTSVNIANANQIHEITEEEAKFRLFGEVHVQSKKTARLGNTDVLVNIRGAGSSEFSTKSINQPRPVSSRPVSTTSPISKASSPAHKGSAQAKTAPTVFSPLTKNQSVIQNMKSRQPAPAATRTQPAKSQRTKTQPVASQQPVPKQVTSKTVIRQKRASLLWIGIGVLLFIPLAVAAFILPLLSNLPQQIENIPATPTKKPAATATSTERAQLPAEVPTKASECIPWDEITVAAKGEIRCIYGEVSSSRDFLENGNNYSLVRFRNSQRSFYLIAYDGTLTYVNIGDCLRAEALVQVDPNGVPFMEPSDISKNQVSCTK